MAELYALRKAGKGRAFGVPTGFHRIDAVVGGLPTGNVSIIGARPSQGKTAIASCIALNAAKQGFPVIFFSHEMTSDDIMARMVCQHAGLSFKHVRKSALSPKGEAKMSAAFGFVQKLPIDIIDEGGALPSECRTTVMYLANKRRNPKPPLVIVDYVQLEHMRRGVKEEFRLQELQEISHYWCETAKITNAAVLLLSQLNRDASGTQPTMNQLAQCGALEQDANVIMLLWRPSKDRKEEEANATPDPSNRRKAGYNWGLLSVPKSRNSDLTEQELFFSGYDMKFRDWTSNDSHQTKSEMMKAEDLAMSDDIVKLNNQPTMPMPSGNADASDIPY
jgi:replicative DNA helicase